MNQTVPQTQSIADALRQVAMIGEISTSGIGLMRTDKVASRQADQQHSAKDGAGKVVVNRFAGADEKIKKITDLQLEASANLKSNTSAWGNSKRRLLPNSNFQRWIGRHTEIMDQFDIAVAELVADADNIIAAAAHNIGSYRVDLPTKQEMETAFSLSYQLEPIPDPGSFGAVMGMDGTILEQADAHLRWQLEENMKAAYNDAKLDAAQRLATPLEKLAERMAAYDQRERDQANGKEGVGRDGYFRDSIITNVQEISAVFGNLNVLNDPHLASIAAKCKAFGRIDAEMLRKRPDIRQAVTARANEVLNDLKLVLVP